MKTTSNSLSRDQWIAACQFHDLTEEEVLREVASRVTDVHAHAKAGRSGHPLVLLDLDSTLYEVQSRTHQILREWIETEESRAYPKVRATLERLQFAHLGYSLKDTFQAAGLSLDDSETMRATEEAKAFWLRRFFTNSYLKYDQVYPGAAEFARELHGLGAELVYLTGRDEPGMGDGTRARLIADGFPWNTERTHLLLKKTFEMDDLDHKLSAGEYVRGHGSLIASFENEPKNLVGLYEAFPEAMHVFVETVSSATPAMPMQGLYRIKGFVG